MSLINKRKFLATTQPNSALLCLLDEASTSEYDSDTVSHLKLTLTMIHSSDNYVHELICVQSFSLHTRINKF